ncbi:cupin domain-containing protein [Halobacillus seohaensis]|uniref:Cupin domain-containing protein n=1 Tax=Halobacillus seohaensis TaxID=447421 RepID=A0ABW2EQ03_9BACI
MSDFESDPYNGFSVEYLSPSNGETAHPNISSRVQKLEAGFHSKVHRHTRSKVLHVFKGEGYTVIDSVRYDWEEGVLLAIPNWAWHEHVSTSADDTYLFTVRDLPRMEKLGLEREEPYQENDGHQKGKKCLILNCKRYKDEFQLNYMVNQVYVWLTFYIGYI